MNSGEEGGDEAHLDLVRGVEVYVRKRYSGVGDDDVDLAVSLEAGALG